MGSIPDKETFLLNTSSEKEYWPVINTISFTHQHKAHKKNRRNREKSQYGPKAFPADILKDYSYIVGETKTNSFGKTYSAVLQNSMTVINNSKKCHKNRPVLHGRINERKVQMFLDTGSEVML